MKKQQKTSQYLEDVIFITRSGVGYVAMKDTKDGEVKIKNHLLNTALHGDLVRVLLYPKTDAKQKAGEVESILARAKEEFVGTVHIEQGVCVVHPQDSRFYTHIVIPPTDSRGVKENDKVLVRIVRWDEKTGIPFGVVKENLGKAGVHETEIQAILRDRGIIDTFPRAVISETENIKREYDQTFKKEMGGRKDMRDIPTFTIDPPDAKDFDDALSVRKLPNGNYEVGIHIADVSFFVKRDTALDIEAARRSTSLYLVDRTIPMLPAVLSNDLCSLKQNENRLTFSVILEMNSKGQVKNRWFGKTIIHSDKRFTYEEAQRVLEKKRGNFYTELSVLNIAAQYLRKEREARGALSFDHYEIQFILDKDGKPIKVFKKKQFATNKLIEEFMILANNEVALFMSRTDKKIKQSFIYRVHDLPDEDKIKELEQIMRALGYKIPPRKKRLTSKDIANMLKRVEGAPHQEMIHMLAVRTLAKAVYTTKNIGHFGLSLKHYTHFTSPIRRYPDLVVHRLLLQCLRKSVIPTLTLKEYEAVSRYATQMEIAANETERDSVKYKQAEYMAARIGNVYEGIISGLTERGIFVSEKETLADGMVSLRDLTDDYYSFDKKKMSIIGRNTKKKYSLGDIVKIKVKDVNVEARQINYVFAE